MSEIVYQFSSSSANNGSAFDGLGVSYGLNNNPNPSPEAVPWDIGGGLVIMFGRYLPIIAPIIGPSNVPSPPNIAMISTFPDSTQ